MEQGCLTKRVAWGVHAATQDLLNLWQLVVAVTVSLPAQPVARRGKGDLKGADVLFRSIVKHVQDM